MRMIDEIIQKAREGRGLLPDEVESILDEATDEDWEEIFKIARSLTDRYFGKKIYFYVPIYFSSSCVNDCQYCGFRRSNVGLRRLRLTAKDFLQEAAFLWSEGYRSLLLVAGEHRILAGEERLSALVSELIREGLHFCVGVEVGALKKEGYQLLYEMGIGRVMLYQETYDREVYGRVHVGEKRDFKWRYHAMQRAMEAGIEKVGLGILLGLSSWRRDLTELIRHARFLQAECGRLPSTLSFPRMRPASGVADFDSGFPPVSDREFEGIIAVTRLALPSVGIILSTRELPSLRDDFLLKGIGVTHVSAGTSTSPGGYTLGPRAAEEGQFSIRDHRNLDEMVDKAKTLGYEPEFYWDEKSISQAPVLA